MPKDEKPGLWQKAETDKFLHRFIVATGFVVAVTVFLIVFWQALYVLLLMFAGVLLAIVLRTFTNGFSSLTRLPDGWSLACVLILLTVFFGGVGMLVVPSLVQQVHEFQTNQAEAIDQFRAWVARMFGAGSDQEATGWAGAILERVGGIFSSTLGLISGLLLIIFVGIFLAAQPEMYVRGLLRLLPVEKRGRAAEVLDELGYSLRWWLVGQLVSMVVLSTQLTLGLWLLGVPLAFTLGFLAALLTFVPYVGAVISTIPAVLIAWTESGSMALAVLALYIVVQNLEGYAITPIIHQKVVHIPPAVTLFSQMLMGIMWGALGVVLATPLAAVALVLVRKIYVEDVLGDSLEMPLIREERIGPGEETLKELEVPEPSTRKNAEAKR
jgi:predicted PurR-regulated permease PerM